MWFRWEVLVGRVLPHFPINPDRGIQWEERPKSEVQNEIFEAWTQRLRL